ncbi:MAG TPA: type II toxin-antitoxin system prevent-host-death family antitoxin [Candidatus Limnocylindrales bacterium]|nr:type II toxin-antitoxin system prevent-host-death family antitoxin [Candidatus Limnocylindrales bacterium]
MSKTIPQRDLRNRNAEVIAAVVEGETFLITRHGTPVAEVAPVRIGRQTLVTRGALTAAVRAGPRLDARRFRGDLDRIIDQALD